MSIQIFNIDYRLDMFRAFLCPSSGGKDHVLLHVSCLLVVFDVAGCGVSTVKVAARAATFTVLTPST